jgi:hypothetical protein
MTIGRLREIASSVFDWFVEFLYRLERRRDR